MPSKIFQAGESIAPAITFFWQEATFRPHFFIMKKTLLSILLCLIVSVAYSQLQRSQLQRSRLDSLRKRPVRTLSPFCVSYADSLQLYRQRFFSDTLRSDTLSPLDDAYSHLSQIVPLTFYHGVTQRLFDIDYTAPLRRDVDLLVSRMYISHPEYVLDTDSRLTAEGEIAFRPDEPVVNNTGMTSQAEEEVIHIPSASRPSSDVTLVTMRPNFWTYSGDFSLQFLQNYVSDNWYKGGESTYSMIGAVTYNANYNDKEKIKWDNRIEMKLGMQSSQGDTLHSYKSSEDLIRLTSKLGIQSVKKWYYTLQFIASTQFTHGYKSNDETVYSDFMSPLNVNLSLGMDYKVEWCKKRLVGTVNISPMAANFKYVDRLYLANKYGISEGKHSLWDIGSTFTTDLTWTFSKLIKWKTRLYAYTTYKRTEVEWENTFNFQLSRYISTSLFVYPRFDDSASKKDGKYGYLQLKEYWSLGFNYSF